MSSLSYRLLRLISRNPELGRYQNSTNLDFNFGADGALHQLKTMFPGFLNEIQNKTIVDYGCGCGYQSMSMAKNQARFVEGIDIDPRHIQFARSVSKKLGLNNIRFSESSKDLPKGVFDIVVSQNSMEHFADPHKIIQIFRSLIHDEGKIFISFGPPWHSPYGAHTAMFCKYPWIHLLFPEEAVMKVRGLFTNDKALRYQDVRDGLNFMSLKKFERLLGESGMKVEYEHFMYALNITLFRHIPVFRELLLYHINVILVSE